MSDPTLSEFWRASTAGYQKNYKIFNEDDQPVICFPLVLEPSSSSLEQVLQGATDLGAKVSDGASPSVLRKLLDINGGAINFKNMPLRSAQDFSAFVSNLAGKGDNAWFPHQDFGMQLLRKTHAENVVTTNEGPSSHIIHWHNEYGVSPSHPGFVVFFCVNPPGGGGETPITSSLGVYDRLKRECPKFLRECQWRGLTYTVHHTPVEMGGIVGGNGVFKPTAFGPLNKSDAERMSPEEKKEVAIGRIKDLARLGGWKEGEENRDDISLPLWQRRGFDWSWSSDGGIDITHRVPGVRMHPTRQVGTFFNTLGTRYANAKKYNSWEPPHRVIKEDGLEHVVLPPLFVGMETDVPIPVEWMDSVNELQTEFSSNVSWEAGDVLVIDNFAVQHARWPWTGDRLILASFWDESGVRAQPIPPDTQIL